MVTECLAQAVTGRRIWTRSGIPGSASVLLGSVRCRQMRWWILDPRGDRRSAGLRLNEVSDSEGWVSTMLVHGR